MTIRHSAYQSTPLETLGQSDFGLSLTLPDQSLTIPQIMDRYARGLPISGYEPVFDDLGDDDFEEVLPDPRTLDIAERAELAQVYRERIDKIKTKRASKPKVQDEPKKEEKKVDTVANPVSGVGASADGSKDKT
jgi:hypothetical protein